MADPESTLPELEVMIRESFPDYPVVVNSVFPNTEEGSALAEFLSGRTWNGIYIDPVLRERLFSNFVWLNPEGCLYYLPVMLLSLVTLTDDCLTNDCWFQVCHALYPPDWSIESVSLTDRLIRLQTPAQLRTVTRVLKYLRGTSIGNQPFLELEERSVLDVMLANCWLAFDAPE